MKRVMFRVPFAILFVFISITVMGQNAFDAKKKSNTQSNSTALKAKTISGKASNAPTTPYINHPLNLSATNKKNGTGTASDGSKNVYRSLQTNLPIFIETDNSQNPVSKAAGRSIPEQTFQYLNQIKTLLNIANPEESFQINKVSSDADGKSHVHLNQLYKGVEVYGSDVIVHLNAAGNGEVFNGRYLEINETVDINPSFSEKIAINFASSHLKSINKKLSSESKETLLSQYEKPDYKLVIYKLTNANGGFKLTYQLTLFTTDHHRWEYFVDAHTGKVLRFYENICFADGPKTASATDLNGESQTINTYQIGSNYYMLDASRTMYKSAGSVLPDEPLGGIVTIDMNNTFGDNQSFKYITSSNNSWNNPKAISAHNNSGIAYEYYRQKHNRNSIDGVGGTIISIINVPEIETGESMENAFWNGKFMCYGNGGVNFKPLAGALDVAGHEMTHGVVENTAALIYQGESGALNESISDIFGCMMDSEDWTMGEDVVKLSAYPSGALRSFSDPHNGGSNINENGYQPKHMNEKYLGEEDNQGVHINSGITNHAFYLYATAIGKDKAAEVFYKTLDDYLTKSSQFIDLRLGVIQAAKDLYGAGSNEVTQAETAFNAVGITDGQGTGEDPTLPENPGDEFVLVYNTDLADANTLYRSTLDQSVMEPLTTTEFLSRPSVTDDGSIAVFVAGDRTIHGISTLPGSQPDEFTLQEETIWANAIVSKDGSKLAAVTNFVDTSIYVYDFGTGSWAQFYLYSPTYTEGVESAGPVYADALEFDYTGEFLVFDCFNSIENTDGANIEYWDVNFIRVWDNEANDFSDGEIFKLFPSLPPNVSVGNPAFSKKSTNIIAFDYFSTDPEEYSVLGCNIETNEVMTLVENNTLGWPTFNKDDSRVAFSSYSTGGDPTIDYVLLNPDKISAQGAALPMFIGAKWPVYYSTGERVISSTPEVKNSGSDINVYPNPFMGGVTLTIPDNISGKSKIEIFSSTGQKVFATDVYNAEIGEVSLQLEQLVPGFYMLNLSDSQTIYSIRLVKMP